MFYFLHFVSGDLTMLHLLEYSETFLMLLSHICDYAYEWANDCKSVRNDKKKFVGVCKHSWDIHKHSRGLAKNRNMLFKFARKA